MIVTTATVNPETKRLLYNFPCIQCGVFYKSEPNMISCECCRFKMCLKCSLMKETCKGCTPKRLCEVIRIIDSSNKSYHKELDDMNRCVVCKDKGEDECFGCGKYYCRKHLENNGDHVCCWGCYGKDREQIKRELDEIQQLIINRFPADRR